MSSVAYGNGVMTSMDEPSASSMPLSSSGAIIPHPYLTSNPNTVYAAVAAAAASPSSSSLGQYQHYYGHSLPQQPLLHAPQAASFYPGAALNHLPHHGDFSNSSSSAASSSSSIESSRKAGNRKRPTDKSTAPPKAAVKRKAVGCFPSLYPVRSKPNVVAHERRRRRRRSGR